MLGTRIAALRKKMGFSQTSLARRINVSPSAIGMYEQGRRYPSAEILIALSHELEVSVEYLLTGNIGSYQDLVVISSHIQEHPNICSFSREELLVLIAAQFTES